MTENITINHERSNIICLIHELFMALKRNNKPQEKTFENFRLTYDETGHLFLSHKELLVKVTPNGKVTLNGDVTSTCHIPYRWLQELTKEQ